ncbi:MAG: translocation/assembly module TamB domain-containing protein [Mariprofundus sp.]
MRRSTALTIMAAAATLCLLTGAGLWVWLGSDSGRQWLGHTITSLSGGSVELRGISGHPLSRLQATSVLVSGGVEIRAESVMVAWSPWRLLTGKLAISRLTVGSIHLQTGAALPAESATPAAPPKVAVELDEMHIGELIIEPEGGAPERISDIRLTALQLGEVLGGHLQAQFSDGELSVQLGGQPALWHLQGQLKSQTQGKMDVSLSGRQLRAGEVTLGIESAYGTVDLASHWQRDQQWSASGTLLLHAGSGDMSADWKLNMPVDMSQAALSMHGVASSATLLQRSMPLDIGVTWAKEQLSAIIEEQGHGLKMALTYGDGELQGDLTLAAWNSSLKMAAGRLSGSLHGAWHAGSKQWHLQGDIDKGELAGLTARMKLDGMGDGERWHVRRADIRALGLSMALAGEGDSKRFTLSGSLAGEDIGPALKMAGLEQAAGKVQADIRLAGSYQTPQGDVTANLTDVTIAALAVEGVSLSAHRKGGDGTGHLVVTHLLMDGRQQVEQLDVSARLHDAHLAMKFSTKGRLQSDASVVATVGEGEHRDAVITGVRVNYATERLLEADRLELHIDGKSIHLPAAGIRLLGATGRLAFDLMPEQVSGKLKLAGLKLSAAEYWLGEMPYRFAGKTGVTLTMSGQPQSPTAALHISAPAVKITHLMFAGEDDASLQMSNVSARLDYQQQQLGWQLHATTPAQGALESHGHLAMLLALQPWQLALPEKPGGSGSLALHIARLSEMQPLLPRVEPIQGSGDLKLRWAMPPTIHSVKGGAKLTLDAFGIPEFGLDMQGALKVGIAAGRPDIGLHLSNGDGELIVTGLLDIDRRTMPELHFNRFPLIQLPAQQLVVSGRIAASAQQNISLIEGALDVVQMRLEIPDPVPGPTADLQWHTNPQKEVDKKRAPLSKLDIDLTLNGDAEIYGRGMSLKPKGELHLGGSVTQPKLTGVLNIGSGKIEFRSVKLDILPQSRVQFSGDPKRPSIYIKAARKIGDVTAGVVIEGPADQLSSRLYSDPALSNAEIFSYIATGRPLASLGQSNVSDMVTAAEFVLGPGTMMQEVQGRVKDVTGLDLFEVGGDSSGGKIKAGRKLSDKVMVTVEQTVAKDASTALTLEYMLSRSLSVFARQTVNVAPMLGLRYSKEWFGRPKNAAVKRGLKPARGDIE